MTNTRALHRSSLFDLNVGPGRARTIAALSVASLLSIAMAACGDDGGSGTDTTDASTTPGTPDAAPGAPDAAPGTPDAAPGTPDAGVPSPDAAPVDEVAGCDGATLLSNPADPAARGPWPVGARTVEVGNLTVEVWYPAAPGSNAGKNTYDYDIRLQLPPSEQDTIPDADNPSQPCDCYRDLPLDVDRGPYPVILFVHGTAAFRHQSLSQVTHWASRGFVVLAADHPGLKLADTLAFLCPDNPSGSRDLSGDLDAMIAAVGQAAGDLAFLSGRVDTGRLAVIGHSAGGNAAAGAATKPGVRAVIPMAASGAVSGQADLETILFLGGTADGVVDYSSTVSAYTGSPTPKRLVGLENAAHLAFSDLCATENGAGKDILEIAMEYDVCGAWAAGFLFDCSDSYLDDPISWEITNYASAAALESALHCSDIASAFSSIESRFPDVSEYRESL